MVDTAFDANHSTEKSCKSWMSKGARGTFWGMSQRRSQIKTDLRTGLGCDIFPEKIQTERPTKTGSRALWP